LQSIIIIQLAMHYAKHVKGQLMHALLARTSTDLELRAYAKINSETMPECASHAKVTACTAMSPDALSV
jgi:hypothetical protein